MMCSSNEVKCSIYCKSKRHTLPVDTEEGTDVVGIAVMVEDVDILLVGITVMK